MTDRNDRESQSRMGEALKDAERAAQGGVPGAIAGLLERIGASAGAGAVFGTPVERGSRTIIPVAQSLWGGGAGSGTGPDESGGSGSGGGARTRAMGYIEVTDHGATYVPLEKPWQDPKVVLVWALAIWLVARAMGRLLRG